MANKLNINIQILGTASALTHGVYGPAWEASGRARGNIFTGKN